MGNRYSRGLGTAGLGTWGLRTRKVALFAGFAGLAFLVTAGAQPTERARTEALAQRASDRLRARQHEADRMASDERALLGELRKLEIERQIRAEELKRVAADTVKVQA